MVRIKDEQYELNEELLHISDEYPVRSEFIWWLKTKKDAKEKEFMFTFNGHHTNGNYARNIDRQHKLVQNDIISKLPDWVDPIWFTCELIEVRL